MEWLGKVGVSILRDVKKAGLQCSSTCGPFDTYGTDGNGLFYGTKKVEGTTPVGAQIIQRGCIQSGKSIYFEDHFIGSISSPNPVSALNEAKTLCNKAS